MIESLSNIIIGLLIYTIILYIILYIIWPSNKKYYTKGYYTGYKDGFVNTKVYFAIKQELPSNRWLMANKGTSLDTRKKIQAAMEKQQFNEYS